MCCASMALQMTELKSKLYSLWQRFVSFSNTSLFLSGLVFGKTVAECSFLGFLIVFIRDDSGWDNPWYEALLSTARDCFSAFLASILAYATHHQRVRPFIMILVNHAILIAGMLMLGSHHRILFFLALALLSVDISAENYIDEFLNDQSEQVADQLTINQSEQVTDQPTVTQSEQVAGQPTVNQSEQVTYQPTVTQSEQVAGQPTVNQSEQVIDQPTVTQSEQVAGQPTVNQSEQVTDQPTVTQSEQVAGQSTVNQSEQVTDQPTITQSEQVVGQPTINQSEQVTDQSAVNQSKLAIDAWLFIARLAGAVMGGLVISSFSTSAQLVISASLVGIGCISVFYYSKRYKVSSGIHEGENHELRPLLKLLPLWAPFLIFYVVDAAASAFFDYGPHLYMIQKYSGIIVSRLIDYAIIKFCSKVNQQVQQRIRLAKISFGMLVCFLLCIDAWHFQAERKSEGSFTFILQYILLGIMNEMVKEKLGEYFYDQVADQSMHHLEFTFNSFVEGMGRLLAVVCILVSRNWIDVKIKKIGRVVKVKNSQLDKCFRTLAFMSLCALFMFVCLSNTCYYKKKNRGSR